MGGICRLRAWAAVATAVGLIVIPLLAAAAGLSAAERRGKRIYAEGEGRKPITAFLAGPRLKATGPSVPCAKCHLTDGTGTKEGGVQSADITFSTLSKTYDGVRPSGRAHPPYTEEGLRSAVLGGFDPGGNALHDAHPRYEMAEADLADLVAYLKVLGREPVPGVTEGDVRVGMLLPEQGPLAEAGKSVRALAAAYFEQLNARGGVFRRRLRLVPIFFDPAKPEAVADAVKGPLEKDDVFCFLGNLGVPPEDKALQRLSAAEVPVIAPLLITSEGGYGADRTTFHIYASVRDQARVMVDFLGQEPGEAKRRVALLYASDQAGSAGAAGVREQAKTDALALVAEVAFPAGGLAAPETVRRLKAASAGAVLFVGPGADAVAFLEEAARQRWRPVFLAPAPLVGASLFTLPPAVAKDVYLASPIATPDPASREMAEFSRLVMQTTVRGDHRSFQLMAYAGAKLLEEGLRRAGRDVTRAKLVDHLGALREFPTGVTPPLTYNENRRVGAQGAAIFKLDGESKRLTAAAAWREPR